MADPKTPAGVLAPKSVSIMPGLDNPENVKRANAALLRRDAADYNCYMLLRALIEEHLDPYGHTVVLDDTEVGQDWYEEALEALKERRDANTSFLAAVAGQEEP